MAMSYELEEQWEVDNQAEHEAEIWQENQDEWGYGYEKHKDKEYEEYEDMREREMKFERIQQINNEKSLINYKNELKQFETILLKFNFIYAIRKFSTSWGKIYRVNWGCSASKRDHIANILLLIKSHAIERKKYIDIQYESSKSNIKNLFNNNNRKLIKLNIETNKKIKKIFDVIQFADKELFQLNQIYIFSFCF